MNFPTYLYNITRSFIINGKREAKIFILKRYTKPTEIKINNQTIIWNNKDQSIKYLGVFLNEKLTWKTHINKKLNQAYTRMRLLYLLLNYSSTLQNKCSLLSFNIYINYKTINNIRMPCMGCCLLKKVKKLQTIQNKFFRITLKSPWFMRNKQLHNNTAIPYLDKWI